MSLNIFDSLSKEIKPFNPRNSEEVTMYTCGPTVYDYAHIGNYRTYVTADFLYRTLMFNDYKVKYVMNLTDLGHLTGDNLGDADTGADRLEQAAEAQGKSAKEIADYFIKSFYKDAADLNMIKPSKYTKATDYITEQIELIAKLEEKGYTYLTSDGVYFDSSKYSDYGALSGLKPNEILEGARVAPNTEKRNPNDFALWKFSPSDKKRWQEYNSPWGVGFPGWHIECSAMILKELGETIDIHIGGEDLRMIHHQNEIAQSECATGKHFVNYWMHTSFLQVDGGKMGKSLGNAYTISDIKDKGYSAIDLRYFFMTAQYRKSLNFTWESLQSAHNSLRKLYDLISGYKESEEATANEEYIKSFNEAILMDLNMPKAISVTWDVLKSDLSESDKIATILVMDEVLGLNIDEHVGFQIPQKVIDLANMRWAYRTQGIFDKADLVRREISEMGYVIEDKKDDFRIKRKV